MPQQRRSKDPYFDPDFELEAACSSKEEEEAPYLEAVPTDAPIPSTASLPPLSTPMLDLAAQEVSDDGGSDAAWPLGDEGFLEQQAVDNGYRGVAPARDGGYRRPDPNEAEDAAPAPAPAPVAPARAPPPGLARHGLPPTADATREVAHPLGWWERRSPIDYSGKYPAKALSEDYKDEQFDASRFRQKGAQFSAHGDDPTGRVFSRSATQHWNAETIEAHRLGFVPLLPQQPGTAVDQTGRGILQQGGKNLDTRGASGVGTQDRTPGKFIFTMDNQGEFTAADAWGEHREVPLGTTAADGRKEHEVRMTNHSTLAGGEAVAGAGELQVDDGKLQEISDSSGHYRPSGRMTANVVKELRARGVELHDTTMRLTKKAGPQLRVSARELEHVQGLLDRNRSSTDVREEISTRHQAFEKDLRAKVAEAPAASPTPRPQDAVALPDTVGEKAREQRAEIDRRNYLDARAGKAFTDPEDRVDLSRIPSTEEHQAKLAATKLEAPVR